MLTRRALIGAGLAAMAATPSLARAKLGDDGLYQLDWYLESFLDLSEDLETATRNGKRLAILWGLKGCPGCRRLHEVHLADPAIEGYIRANFEILHLNHIGAREVTDFDGRKLSEKSLGEAYGVRFTPTILFFPESPSGLAQRKPQAREVARMAGLLEPPQFLAMFRYVREKGYESAPFPDWLKRQST
ncbi:MAG: thioredoxin fold domain-containing protein [Pseudorhodoplanes sp.]|nr:thioredoxin fold domain-containing protein [Pseudorhodoplanes sp.]